MELAVFVHESSQISHKLLSQRITKRESKLKVNRNEKDIYSWFELWKEVIKKCDELGRCIERVMEVRGWTCVSSHRKAAHLFSIFIDLYAAVFSIPSWVSSTGLLVCERSVELEVLYSLTQKMTRNIEVIERVRLIRKGSIYKTAGT